MSAQADNRTSEDPDFNPGDSGHRKRRDAFTAVSEPHKMKNGKLGRLMAILGGLLLAYGYWIWPTPWRHWSLQQAISQPSHIAHVTRRFQTNRFDGHIENCTAGLFGANDCHPITEAELQTIYGPLTIAQLKEAHRRW